MDPPNSILHRCSSIFLDIQRPRRHPRRHPEAPRRHPGGTHLRFSPLALTQKASIWVLWGTLQACRVSLGGHLGPGTSKTKKHNTFEGPDFGSFWDQYAVRFCCDFSCVFLVSLGMPFFVDWARFRRHSGDNLMTFRILLRDQWYS